MDLKSKFHLQVIQNGRLGFWYPKERVDSWTNRISQNVRHNLTSAELLSEQENAKERKLCLAKSKTGTQETGAASDPSSRKLDADPVSFSLSPVYYTKRTIPTKERKWKLIPSHSSYTGGSLSTAISQKVTRLVRHYDQEERQSDAAVRWDTIRPKLLRAFADRGARDFSETDWLRHIHEGSNKTRFEHCEDSKKSLTSFRAIQGHTGGITIAPELIGTSWFHTIGKSLCFTGVVPSTSTPSLRMDSLQEENRASRGDKPSSSLSGKIQMKKHPVMTSQFPGKCTITAVGNLSRRRLLGKIDRTQDQGLRFWQTKSSAIIVHNLVPADCIYRVISQNGDPTLWKDSQPLDLRRRWHFGELGSSSSLFVMMCRTSTRKLAHDRTEIRDVQGYTTDDQTSSGKPVRNAVSLVDKKPQFEIDLRMEGVLQDAILKDEEQMKEINKKLEKFRIWIMHKIPS